jgi:hypothetical protein
MREIGRLAFPFRRPSEELEFDAFSKAIQSDPKMQRTVKKAFKKAVSTIRAQQANGLGFPVDELLRYFHNEYNGRVFKHGLLSMPTSFNLMESFFDYIPDCNYFRLRPETDYLISFPAFLDFVTSPDVPSSIYELDAHLADGQIYSFNVLNDPKEILFSIDEGREYAVGGVSLIRHGAELNILLLAGEKTSTSDKTKELRKDLKVVDTYPGKEGIASSDDRELEAVPLLGNPDLWQVVVLTRMDIRTMTNDVRYVLFDNGNSYAVATDDINVFLGRDGSFVKPDYEEIAKRSRVEVQKYQALIEICNTCLYLPYYVAKNAEQIVVEDHRTRFGEQSRKGSWASAISLIPSSAMIGTRKLQVLEGQGYASPDVAVYRPPIIKEEITGYWRRLSPAQVGTDKDGKEIHGRTWVKQTVTWIEHEHVAPCVRASHAQSEKRSRKLEGYIYVMRCAAHDKDIFKIGLTKRSTEARAKELSQDTRSPDAFLVVQQWDVSNCADAEKMIHQALDAYRINPGREYFKAPYQLVQSRIHEVLAALGEI